MKCQLWEYGYYLIGLFYSVFIGHCMVKMNVNALYNNYETSRKENCSIEGLMRVYWHVEMLGMLERTAYFFSILIDVKEFIGLYLGMKVVVQWKG